MRYLVFFFVLYFLFSNPFESISPMVDIFMQLCYLTRIDPTVREPEDALIFTRKGSLTPGEDGRLSAFVPPIRDPQNSLRDGRIVGLRSGDSDSQYNRSIINGVYDQVIGINFRGLRFSITNGNELTRVN